MTTIAAERTSSDRSRYALFILTLIYVFNTMDRHIFSILAEPVRRDLHMSDTQLGVLTGLAFALFYTFFGVPAGWMADRVGRVRVITAACVIWSCCSAAGGLATNFLQLALSRMGVGIGEAGGAAPSYSLISAFYPPKRRGAALGAFHTGSAVGMLVGSTACAWLAATYGWRVAVVAVSLPGVIFGLVLWLTLSEPARSNSEEAQPAFLASLAAFVRDPLLRLTAVTAGLSSFTGFGISAWLPAFLMRVKGMTLPEFALWFGLPYSVVFAFGLWAPGWLADKLSARTPRAYAFVPMTALLTAAPLIAMAVLAPGWPLSFAVWLAAFSLSQMFLAPLLVIIQNRSPEMQRSTFSALFLFANNLIGAGFGPLYVGAISDLAAPAFGKASLGVGLAALIPVAFIACAALWRISRRL